MDKRKDTLVNFAPYVAPHIRTTVIEVEGVLCVSTVGATNEDYAPGLSLDF